MRLTTVFGACALLVGVSSVAQAQASQKVAFVNSQAILANAPGRAEAEAQFEKEMTGTKDKLAKLQDSLQALSEAYSKEEPNLQGAAKDARLKTLREKEQGFQAQAQKLQDQAQQRQEELMAPIMEGVRKALDDVRMDGGYSFIFDVAAGAFIVSADKNLDITDRVVAKMRLSAPKVIGAPARPATGPAAAPAGISTKKPPTA
jgi:outer membrane protein